jgi:sulfonate transport system substrate-binding protein
MKHKIRKLGLGILLIAWICVAYFGYKQIAGDSSTLETVTVGYQKADPIDISKTRGELAKKMKKKGYKVVFKQFQDGTALMTALKSGDIDYARLGDTPGIINQAAGTDIVYVAAGAAKSEGSGIVIPENSTIKSMQDLKGKKVAYTKGTSSQYLLLNALKQAGMSATDITWVNLDSSAASVAFAKGKVDAWATWDPMTATAEVKQNATLLVNGSNGVSNNRDFILSTKEYAESNTDVSKLLVDYIEDDMEWANQNESELVDMLSDSLNLSKKIIKKMVERRTYSMGSMTDAIVAEQQKIADLFYEEGVISKKIKVSDITTYLNE